MKKLFITWDDLTGSLGAAMAIVTPFINTITPILQFLGCLGGLVMLMYSIYHKRLQIKKLKGE